jgi:hypothetical protein
LLGNDDIESQGIKVKKKKKEETSAFFMGEMFIVFPILTYYK